MNKNLRSLNTSPDSSKGQTPSKSAFVQPIGSKQTPARNKERSRATKIVTGATPQILPNNQTNFLDWSSEISEQYKIKSLS